MNKGLGVCTRIVFQPGKSGVLASLLIIAFQRGCFPWTPDLLSDHGVTGQVSYTSNKWVWASWLTWFHKTEKEREREREREHHFICILANVKWARFSWLPDLCGALTLQFCQCTRLCPDDVSCIHRAVCKITRRENSTQKQSAQIHMNLRAQQLHTSNFVADLPSWKHFQVWTVITVQNRTRFL